MKTALAILPNSCARTALRPWFEARCQERGVKLRCLTVDEARGGFREHFRSERNVMAWNFRMLPAWMLCEGQNVLHLDNALISQKRGLFVDARGFFANSHLSRRAAESLKTLPRWNAEFYARRDFGWQAFHEGRPGGPVLVCLQCEKDSSVTQGFLRGQRGVRRMAELLRLVRLHLPVEPERVIIRPHPREPLGDLPEGLLDPRWQWSRDEKFAQVVRRCGAVVTVNSTCAHEAVLAGVPVATLGTGTFTTWGATLECAGRPERLAELPGWRPDPEVARKYVSHAMTRHFLPHDVRPERINPEFQTWLEDCI